jgi:hypothetical protein
MAEQVGKYRARAKRGHTKRTTSTTNGYEKNRVVAVVMFLAAEVR